MEAYEHFRLLTGLKVDFTSRLGVVHGGVGGFVDFNSGRHWLAGWLD